MLQVIGERSEPCPNGGNGGGGLVAERIGQPQQMARFRRESRELETLLRTLELGAPPPPATPATPAAAVEPEPEALD